MRRIYLLSAIVLAFCAIAFGQVSLPRESQRQEIAQTVGDAKVTIVYHRPNAKARKIWGCETKDVIPIANNPVFKAKGRERSMAESCPAIHPKGEITTIKTT